jgi:hypothetical protein
VLKGHARQQWRLTNHQTGGAFMTRSIIAEHLIKACGANPGKRDRGGVGHFSRTMNGEFASPGAINDPTMMTIFQPGIFLHEDEN